MITVSAPGKVHLMGEHSVVYGEPAIIAAIGMRSQVKADKSEKVSVNSVNLTEKATWDLDEVRSFTVTLDDLWKNCFEDGDFTLLDNELKETGLNPLKIAIGRSLQLMEIPSGISIEIDSKIPMGAGLGSSASLSVAIPKAISETYSKPLPKHEINEVAYEIEKFNHGTPSGGDNSTCCYGGFVWFQKRSNDNIINPLKDEIPSELKNFVIAYVKEPEKTTGELVQMVRSLKPEIRIPIIKRLGELTVDMRNALRDGDSEKIKKLMNSAQENLAKLGISTKEIDQIYNEVKKIDGAAKISGAGGGGAMICYHDEPRELVDLISDLGHEALKTELGVEGVRVER
ncbi:MAG: mevalonate kinase [Candidatus Hydrothermarchaeales archaeon]